MSSEAINLYELQETQAIGDLVDKYYRRLSEYHELYLSLLGPDEYKVVQQTFGFPETWEEHIAILRASILPKEHTANHLKEFLTEFTEFRSESYLDVFDQVLYALKNDREGSLQTAGETFAKFSEIQQNRLESESDSDDEDEDFDHNKIPDTIPIEVCGQVIELPSYNDPLMIDCYSLCFMTYNMKMDYVRQMNTDGQRCHTNANLV